MPDERDERDERDENKNKRFPNPFRREREPQEIPGVRGPQGERGYAGAPGPIGPAGKDADINTIKPELDNTYAKVHEHPFATVDHKHEDIAEKQYVNDALKEMRATTEAVARKTARPQEILYAGQVVYEATRDNAKKIKGLLDASEKAYETAKAMKERAGLNMPKPKTASMEASSAGVYGEQIRADFAAVVPSMETEYGLIVRDMEVEEARVDALVSELTDMEPTLSATRVEFEKGRDFFALAEASYKNQMARVANDDPMGLKTYFEGEAKTVEDFKGKYATLVGLVGNTHVSIRGYKAGAEALRNDIVALKTAATQNIAEIRSYKKG